LLWFNYRKLTLLSLTFWELSSTNYFSLKRRRKLTFAPLFFRILIKPTTLRNIVISLMIRLFYFNFECFHWFLREKNHFLTQKSYFYSESRKFYSIQNTAQKYFLVNLLFLPLLKISCFIALTFLLLSKNKIFLNLLKNQIL
jgi:hypothetical protein